MGKFLPSGPDIPLRRRRRVGTAEIFFSSKWGFIIRARRRGWAGTQERATRPYREWMKFANLAWKYLPGELRASYLRFGAITGYSARDIFFSLLSGNLFQFEFPDGRIVYGMGYLDRVSRNLDAVSQRRGALLRRGEEFWEEIPPGPEGSFLRIVGGLPNWSIADGWTGGLYLVYPPLVSGIYGGGGDDWGAGGGRFPLFPSFIYRAHRVAAGKKGKPPVEKIVQENQGKKKSDDSVYSGVQANPIKFPR